MQKTINTIFIILLSSILVSSLKVGPNLVEVSSEINTERFDKIVNEWIILFKKTHALADSWFSEISKGADEISRDDYFNSFDPLFHYNDHVLEAIPQNILDLWVDKVPRQGPTIDRQEAQLSFQNGIVLGFLMKVYTIYVLKPEGNYGKQVVGLVEQFYDSFTKFGVISKELFEQADQDDDGHISLQEFKDLFGLLLTDESNMEAEFNVLDYDESGVLEQEEIIQLLAKVLLRKNRYFIHKEHDDEALKHYDEDQRN
jgi:hypothetical protein